MVTFQGYFTLIPGFNVTPFPTDPPKSRKIIARTLDEIRIRDETTGAPRKYQSSLAGKDAPMEYPLFEYVSSSKTILYRDLRLGETQLHGILY